MRIYLLDFQGSARGSQAGAAKVVRSEKTFIIEPIFPHIPQDQNPK